MTEIPEIYRTETTIFLIYPDKVELFKYMETKREREAEEFKSTISGFPCNYTKIYPRLTEEAG